MFAKLFNSRCFVCLVKAFLLLLQHRKIANQKGDCSSTVLHDCQNTSQVTCAALPNLKMVAILLASTRNLLKFRRFESVQNKF